MGNNTMLRSALILEYLARGLSMGAISKELKLNPNIVRKTVLRLEAAGQLSINRNTYPLTISVLGFTPTNAGSIHKGKTTSKERGKTSPIFALRNFAVKFQLKGSPPVAWRRHVWRGGDIYTNYVRGVRCEVYIGKKGARSLIIFAPQDLEGIDSLALEHEAIEYCRRLAAYLADKFKWELSEQYNINGAVIPVRKGEYELKPLKPYAEQFRKLKLTPIFHERGKIDKSPKPAAFQVYTGEWAGRVWEAPAQIDKLASSFDLYNANIVKHLEVLDKIGARIGELGEAVKDLRGEVKRIGEAKK